jgi:hypothetical protein
VLEALRRWRENWRFYREWRRDPDGVLSVKHSPVTTFLHIRSDELQLLTDEPTLIPEVLAELENQRRRAQIRVVK